MSISCTYVSKVSGVQTVTGGFVSPSDSTVTVDQLTESGTLNAATSVPVTKQAAFEKAMSAGAGTIDLTALPGLTPEETISLNGLKVQILKIRNKITNANKITVSKGVSNGYSLDANSTAWSVVLSPGQSALFLLNEAAPDVSGSSKTIDIVGTLAQVLEFHAVAG